MYLDRCDFSLRLVLLSDLHIGDGDTALLSELRPRARTDKGDPSVATVARDGTGLPYIPSTSLKGAVRNLVEDEALAQLLFGASPDRNGEGGSGGRLILWQARMDRRSLPESLDLPHWDGAKATFINAHARIDRDSGAAERGRLFSREYVPRGTAFQLDACWLGALEEFETRVLPLFAEIRSPRGFAVGANSGAGYGRARLDDEQVTVAGKSLRIDPGTRIPEVKEVQETFPLPLPVPREHFEVQIHCEGPFLIADPVRAQGTSVESDILALRRSPTMPELLGTSLTGYLRFRSGWLEQVRFGGPADDPDVKYVAGRTLLTRTQRLFGIVGWAGLLRIVDIELATVPGPERAYPGIQLDDFTQAAIFGALFHVRAPADVGFNVILELGDFRRRPTGEDRQLLEALLADLATYGLKLGHSEGAGFGWFKLSGQTFSPHSPAFIKRGGSAHG